MNYKPEIAARGHERRGVVYASLLAGTLAVGGILTPFVTHNEGARIAARSAATASTISSAGIIMDAARRRSHREIPLSKSNAIDNGAQPDPQAAQAAEHREFWAKRAAGDERAQAEYDAWRADTTAAHALLDELASKPGPATDAVLLDSSFIAFDIARGGDYPPYDLAA